MILYNQTQDYFSPEAHYEQTPSQVLDREYEIECNKLQSFEVALDGMEYENKRWQIERRCQKILFEGEVNKLLFYAASVIEVIEKIKKYKEIPMIEFGFFDPRDIPQIYNECMNMYSEITGEAYKPVKFPDDEVSTMQTFGWKTYSITEIKRFFKVLEKIASKLKNIDSLEKKISLLSEKLGRTVSLNGKRVKLTEVTVSRLELLMEQCEMQSVQYVKDIEELQYQYAKSEFQKAVDKMGKAEIIAFCTEQYGCDAEREEIPRMGLSNDYFVVNKTDTNTIERYLKRIAYAEKYFAYIL